MTTFTAMPPPTEISWSSWRPTSTSTFTTPPTVSEPPHCGEYPSPRILTGFPAIPRETRAFPIPPASLSITTTTTTTNNNNINIINNNNNNHFCVSSDFPKSPTPPPPPPLQCLWSAEGEPVAEALRSLNAVASASASAAFPSFSQTYHSESLSPTTKLEVGDGEVEGGGGEFAEGVSAGELSVLSSVKVNVGNTHRGSESVAPAAIGTTLSSSLSLPLPLPLPCTESSTNLPCSNNNSSNSCNVRYGGGEIVYSSYWNPEIGLRFEYPTHWEKEESAKDNVHIVKFRLLPPFLSSSSLSSSSEDSPGHVETTQDAESQLIVIVELLGASASSCSGAATATATATAVPLDTYKELCKSTVLATLSSFSEIEIQKEAKCQFAEQEAWEIVYTQRFPRRTLNNREPELELEPEPELRLRNVFTVIGDRAVCVQYISNSNSNSTNSTNSNSSRYEADVQRVADSLQVTGLGLTFPSAC